jgi:hypothetical protein
MPSELDGVVDWVLGCRTVKGDEGLPIRCD